MHTSTVLPRHRRIRAVLVAAGLMVGALTVAGCAGSGSSTTPTPSPARSDTDDAGAGPAAPVADSETNPWAANDCAALLAALGDQAHAYGC